MSLILNGFSYKHQAAGRHFRLRNVVFSLCLFAGVNAVYGEVPEAELGSARAAATTSQAGKTGADLAKLIDGAAAGATIQLTGTYTAAPGTTYVVYRKLNLTGKPATLVNIRLIFLADVNISNLNFVEQDCTFHVASVDTCTPASPLITIGYPGYSIGSATVSNVTMNFTRAYTGIAFGGGPTENVTIDGFTITDNEMSGITGLAGKHIMISNGLIIGGTQSNVDDGVALYSVYGELLDVTVQNVRAQNTFDLVGIGALMYYPIHDINVTDSQCDRTAVCVYVKSGDQSPVPAGVAGYSTLSHVAISHITDSDSGGSRYRSSIWVVGAGGAKANDIAISHLTSLSRAAMNGTARIKVITDSQSHLSDVVLSDLDIRDPLAGQRTTSGGYPATEGIYIQDLGKGNIARLTFTNTAIDGARSSAVDSTNAVVNTLAFNQCSFTNMNLDNRSLPMMLIPYTYQVDGMTVTK